MLGRLTSAPRKGTLAGALIVLTGFLVVIAFAGAAATGSAAVDSAAAKAPSPTRPFTSAGANDLPLPLRVLAAGGIAPDADDPGEEDEEGPIATGEGHSPTARCSRCSRPRPS